MKKRYLIVAKKGSRRQRIELDDYARAMDVLDELEAQGYVVEFKDREYFS